MSPLGRKVLELGIPLVPPRIFVCSPPPRSSPFTVIGAGLRSSLTHLRSSLASHRPPLRWFAVVLANPLFVRIRDGFSTAKLPQGLASRRPSLPPGASAR